MLVFHYLERPGIPQKTSAPSKAICGTVHGDGSLVYVNDRAVLHFCWRSVHAVFLGFVLLSRSHHNAGFCACNCNYAYHSCHQLQGVRDTPARHIGDPRGDPYG